MHPAKEFYLTSLRRLFPPVRFAFAYGSAVFVQHGRARGEMLDMIFAVDEPVNWHHENLKMNWSHYSALKYLGPKWITRVQECTAGVYYNPLVSINTQLVKYGVISMKDLYKDLITWKWFYISGRLHKPVLFLTSNKEEKLSKALNSNLKSAALCGLLLLPESEFSEEALYQSIAGLSYEGDFRMHVGEDKNKVFNIVKPNLAAFKSLYEPHLKDLVVFSDTGVVKKAPHNILIQSHRNQLPNLVTMSLKCNVPIKSVLSRTVRKSSIQQSAKGILSSGLIKSFKYSHEKIKKKLASRS